MYEEEISDKSRKIMAIIALAYGIFHITLAPILFEATWKKLMQQIVNKLPTEPLLETAPFFHTIWFSFARSISMLAGITLIVIAYSILKKEPWAYPLSLLCIALPIILNVILAIPHLAQGLGMAPSILIIIVGLACYWTFILLKKGTPVEKASRFAIFSLLGAIAGQINILVLHGTKSTFSQLDVDLMGLFDPRIHIYTIEAPINFFAMVMLCLSIYLLAYRNPKGYYVALIAGVSIFVVNIVAQIIRMETFDFLGAAIFAAILVVLLLVPVVKASLIGPVKE